ncbi:hypothetical protein [Agrilutibacter solisilvae]|uniref:DUF4156 domain-containing protein n=1 Tax=Agrilutibacter solisilvae TaxID=2763317 RepID=A0A974Y287_9GAMM|nr:hypothetical protein [Lysobacter solisilvae]QSX79203.1 hypothetical protein I8J32_004740 [Lysobacter solisilvae]
MSAKTLAFALALPLCMAALAPAQAAGAANGQDTPTLEQVTAPVPATTVRVSCANAMWPTLRQVARYTGETAETAAPVRMQVVKEGRQLCDQGSTHVLVVFNAPHRPVDEIAMIYPLR